MTSKRQLRTWLQNDSQGTVRYKSCNFYMQKYTWLRNVTFYAAFLIIQWVNQMSFLLSIYTQISETLFALKGKS